MGRRSERMPSQAPNYYQLNMMKKTFAYQNWHEVCFFFEEINYLDYFIFVEYRALRGVDFWISGTDQGCKGRNHWCSIKRALVRQQSQHELVERNWGRLHYMVNFSNQSQFSKSPCTEKLSYICEVIY